MEEMKLKIVLRNQESSGEGEEQVMKNEALEMRMEEEEEEEDEEVRICSMKDDLVVPDPSPDSDSNPLVLSGKRKRKPKEMLYSPSSVQIRKTSSSSKSKNGTSGAGTSRSKKATANNSGSGSASQVKSPTMIQAEGFMSSLGNDQPSFLKQCVRSHVASCFWMGLPVPFCKIHLPRKDSEVILENENREEFTIKYIANKTGLSAGWRKFVCGNKLVEGDVLVFQLTGPCRFKVYTIRENELTEVDGALSLLNLDSQTKPDVPEGTPKEAKSKKKRHTKSLPLTVVQKKKLKAVLREEQSENDSDEVASEVLEGAKCSSTSLAFKNVKSFEQFHIMVNGSCIDSDLPEDIRRKYYDLCCSKDSFLHDRLLPGLYSKLAAGMIVETINIVEFLRGCDLSTPKKDFEVWEKSLRSFELLGLNVGFLRTRLHQLLKLAFESEGSSEIRRYWEAQKEQTQTRDEIEKLEAKIMELRGISAKYDDEMENLRMKAESYRLKFQKKVDAHW